MDHWCEARVVIGWNLTDFAFFLSSCIGVGVDSADEPEHGWHAPLYPERSKVLACSSRLRFLHPVSGKMEAKRIAHSLGSLDVISHKRIAIEGRDLWFP